MEDWKIAQLSLTRDAIRSFLSGEKKSSKEEPEARTRRLTLFDYLVEHKIQHLKTESASSKAEPVHLTRYEVIEHMEGIRKEEFKKKPPPERKKIETRLRGRKASLSDSLERFDAVAGHKRLPFSFHIEDDSWEIAHREQDCAMKRFWEPYFLDCNGVHIIYGENVFFRTGKDMRLFVRHLDVNEEDAIADIQSRSGLPAQAWWQGGRQFASSGDCFAVVDLVKRFERNGLPTNVMRYAEMKETWEPRDKEGLIVLGNGRVIPWIPKLLKAEKFDWQIDGKGFKNIHRKSDTEDDFSKPFISGIVARTCSNGHWLTIITANHGRFCEASVRCFSSEKDLARVYRENKWESLPSRFAFKATVNLTELEDVMTESMQPIPFDVTD